MKNLCRQPVVVNLTRSVYACACLYKAHLFLGIQRLLQVHTPTLCCQCPSVCLPLVSVPSARSKLCFTPCPAMIAHNAMCASHVLQQSQVLIQGVQAVWLIIGLILPHALQLFSLFCIVQISPVFVLTHMSSPGVSRSPLHRHVDVTCVFICSSPGSHVQNEANSTQEFRGKRTPREGIRLKTKMKT